MTYLRPVHTIITASLTVTADLAARRIGFTSDTIQSSILEKTLGHAHGRASNRRLLTQISTSIQRQLGCLLVCATTIGSFLGKSIQSEKSHHREKYLSDSLQSHMSS
jgi:hypothetical protein